MCCVVNGPPSFDFLSFCSSIFLASVAMCIFKMGTLVSDIEFPAQGRPRKEKNLASEEESQLCHSWAHISQDSCTGNSQRANSF